MSSAPLRRTVTGTGGRGGPNLAISGTPATITETRRTVPGVGGPAAGRPALRRPPTQGLQVASCLIPEGRVRGGCEATPGDALRGAPFPEIPLRSVVASWLLRPGRRDLRLCDPTARPCQAHRPLFERSGRHPRPDIRNGHVCAAPVGAQIHTEWSLEPRGACDTPTRQRDEVVLLTITWPFAVRP
jgi:hypothetical protein